MIEFSREHLDKFVRDDDQAKAAIWFCRTEASRLGKLGNSEAQHFANACAELHEYCNTLETLIGVILLPRQKKKRGRPRAEPREKKRVGAPKKWSDIDHRFLIFLRALGGQKLAETEPNVRVTDARAIEAALKTLVTVNNSEARRKIRALAKRLTEARKFVQKLDN